MAGFLIKLFFFEQIADGFLMRHTGPALEKLSRWFWVEEKGQGPTDNCIQLDGLNPITPETDLNQAAAQAFIHFVYKFNREKASLCHLDCTGSTLSNPDYVNLAR